MATNTFFSMVFATSVIHLICVADTPTTAGSGADPDMVEQMVGAMEIDSRPSLTSSVGGSSGSIPILTPISLPAGELIMSALVVKDVVVLNEMSFCHTFAARARQILVRMALNWEIAPPLDLLSPLLQISPATAMGKSNKEVNLINWKGVMEREGVFERQEGDSDREGLRRSTSYNFFCPDAGENIPLQDEGNLEVGMSGRGEDVDMPMQIVGGDLGGGNLMPSDGKPFFTPFLAQRLPLVRMKREEGGKSTF